MDVRLLKDIHAAGSRGKTTLVDNLLGPFMPSNSSWPGGRRGRSAGPEGRHSTSWASRVWLVGDDLFGTNITIFMGLTIVQP